MRVQLNVHVSKDVRDKVAQLAEDTGLTYTEVLEHLITRARVRTQVTRVKVLR